MLWILAGRMIDGTGAPPRVAVAIGIEGDRIVEVRPADNARTREGDVVVDHRQGTLLPGLIDSHVHLAFNHDVENEPIRHMVETADLQVLTLRAMRNAQMCLAAGITTVRDCGDRGLVTLKVRDAIRAGWLAGPRILASGPPVTTTGGHLSWCGGEADTVDDVRRAVRGLCKAGVDLIKVMSSGGNMTPGSNPLAPQYAEPELREAAAEAHRLGRTVAAHAINAESVRLCVAAGVDTIEHCVWNTPAGVQYDENVARRLVAQGIRVGANFAGIDRILLASADESAEASRNKRDRLRDRWEPIRQMLQLGADVMISSDAGVRYCRFEDFYLSLVCAAEALEIDPVKIVHRATLVPARALGLNRELGSIEPGKLADLLLVDGDPSRDIADLRVVRQVWRDGRVAAEDGRVRGPDDIPLRVPEGL